MAETLRCLIVDDDPMNLRIMELLVDKTENLECVATCSDGVEAFNVLQKEKVDLVFLDVEMPNMTGIELISSLQKTPQIVLVTSEEKYAVPAFELNVTDYIVKPVDYPRFLRALNKVRDSIRVDVPDSAQQDTGKLFVKVNSQLVGLDLDEVTMVEAMADYVRIYVGEKRHTVYSSMKGIASKLPESQFMRVHRSYIVNLKMIDVIEDNTLVVKGNLVPVGVTYLKTLMAKLNTL